jgi:hypothetical protein
MKRKGIVVVSLSVVVVVVIAVVGRVSCYDKDGDKESCDGQDARYVAYCLAWILSCSLSLCDQ